MKLAPLFASFSYGFFLRFWSAVFDPTNECTTYHQVKWWFHVQSSTLFIFNYCWFWLFQPKLRPCFPCWKNVHGCSLFFLHGSHSHTRDVAQIFTCLFLCMPIVLIAQNMNTVCDSFYMDHLTFYCHFWTQRVCGRGRIYSMITLSLHA